MRNILQQFTSSRNQVLWHVVFWVSYVLFFGLLYGSADGDYGYSFAEVFITLPIKMVFTYLILYFLIPKYLLEGRYLEFTGILLITCIVFGFMQRTIFFYGIQTLFESSEMDYKITPTNILKSIVGMYIVAALAVMIKLIKHIYKKEKEQQELAQRSLEAELKFLKSQIHPHFLFNTLNNLYALTLKNSKEAPEVVLKLSDLLDYMLYECNENRIAISKEISSIQNYIELEKLRYGDRLDVSFNASVNIPNRPISPMMILPFVENCFKHGVSQKTDHNWVLIDLNVKGNIMTLKVENSKPNELKHRILKKEHHDGIGLTNVKRRLELLYKDAYELQIFNESDTFLVVLRLELDEVPEKAMEVANIGF